MFLRNLERIKMKREFVLVLFFLLLFPVERARAYVDPGTGSYLVQVLIGLIFGAGYALKVFWGRIIHFFKKNSKKGESKQEK